MGIQSFTEEDFRFKDNDVKIVPAETKGNYNFLANYTQPKREEPPTMSNQNNPTNTGMANYQGMTNSQQQPFNMTSNPQKPDSPFLQGTHPTIIQPSSPTNNFNISEPTKPT